MQDAIQFLLSLPLPPLLPKSSLPHMKPCIPTTPPITTTFSANSFRLSMEHCRARPHTHTQQTMICAILCPPHRLTCVAVACSMVEGGGENSLFSVPPGLAWQQTHSLLLQRTHQLRTLCRVCVMHRWLDLRSQHSTHACSVAEPSMTRSLI